MARATKRLRAVLLPIASLAILLVAMEAAKKAGGLPVFVPAPSQVAMMAWSNPTLITGNVVPTLVKALAGYGLAAVITLVLGSIGVIVRVLYGPIYNIGVSLHAIPIIATAPLLALSMGNGPQVQITIAALASQFPMLVGTMQGLQSADAKQRELMHVLSASRFQMLRYLMLPSALPYMFAGFKIAAPSAVLGAVTAEWAGADRGVGAMMLYALFAYDTPKVWLSVVLTCLLAAAGYGAWAVAERALIYWERNVELEQ
jgi:ABC-type nitrate/sulfonate/bicarbonate transport system permease component